MALCLSFHICKMEGATCLNSPHILRTKKESGCRIPWTIKIWGHPSRGFSSNLQENMNKLAFQKRPRFPVAQSSLINFHWPVHMTSIYWAPTKCPAQCQVLGMLWNHSLQLIPHVEPEQVWYTTFKSCPSFVHNPAIAPILLRLKSNILQWMQN